MDEDYWWFDRATHSLAINKFLQCVVQLLRWFQSSFLRKLFRGKVKGNLSEKPLELSGMYDKRSVSGVVIFGSSSIIRPSMSYNIGWVVTGQQQKKKNHRGRDHNVALSE